MNLPNQSPPFGPERQWIKKFAQASIQWVPMGISAWFFLDFLTEQAWFNAILTSGRGVVEL